MSLFTARESNQFNSFLSSLEVEESGPSPPAPSQWPGGNESHQGFVESRGAGADQPSYSYRIPLSPSQYIHQQSQPSYPSSSSYPSNSHPQKRRISGSATASSSSPSSSLPWPQPETGLVHVSPSPTRRASQQSMEPRIERRGSAEWTVPIYRSLPSPRDNFDSERERGRPPPPSSNGMGLVDHPARSIQSLPPPHGPSPGSSSYPPSSSSSSHLGPPRLPALPSNSNGTSISRSLSPSKPLLQQHHHQQPQHPHDQRPASSYRSHPIPPQPIPSTSTSSSFVPPTPNSVFSAPPMPPPLRARSPVIPALLTASQKKANHIASEQKRRANIRRGYDALCNEIPSLREASRLEALKTSGSSGSGSGAGRRGSRARKKVEGTAEPESKAEKVDGRSGPKSEGIVLVKTIEHLRDLLNKRLGLLSRLDQLRSQAKAFYPREEHSRMGLEGGGPWEMEWEGGKEDEGSDDDGEE